MHEVTMGIKATVLRVDGTTSTHVFPSDDPPLHWMQETVGGFIEFVPNLACTVVVNHDQEQAELPVNELAARRFGRVESPDGQLHGNVILIEMLP